MPIFANDDARTRLKRVRCVVCDVDGTLSRGIHLDCDGGEIKVFCEKDAPRIVAVRERGIPFVMISGRNSGAARARANELGVSFFHRREIGRSEEDQLTFLETHVGRPRDSMLYIGDD